MTSLNCYHYLACPNNDSRPISIAYPNKPLLHLFPDSSLLLILSSYFPSSTLSSSLSLFPSSFFFSFSALSCFSSSCSSPLSSSTSSYHCCSVEGHINLLRWSIFLARHWYDLSFCAISLASAWILHFYMYLNYFNWESMQRLSCMDYFLGRCKIRIVIVIVRLCNLRFGTSNFISTTWTMRSTALKSTLVTENNINVSVAIIDHMLLLSRIYFVLIRIANSECIPYANRRPLDNTLGWALAELYVGRDGRLAWLPYSKIRLLQ